ncbi:MAG: hypothetical protein AW08_00581 [Candidatus Accumulibacter adjunctus]|uniref:Uncharacterized protein n=1 Tax=Candidatus Accumulibacter adjunctus TaxID=1454001 RepID=A0A011NXL1_9PROT|nr:MAG: hypothetical protein AW08_00581 [Candidatus Accumulibacter adjunctus]
MRQGERQLLGEIEQADGNGADRCQVDPDCRRQHAESRLGQVLALQGQRQQSQVHQRPGAEGDDVEQQGEVACRARELTDQRRTSDGNDDQADRRNEVGRRHVFEAELLAGERCVKHRQAESEGQHRPRPPERERQADVRAEGEKLRGDDQHGDRQGRIETGLHRMPQRCQCELRVQEAAGKPGKQQRCKECQIEVVQCPGRCLEDRPARGESQRVEAQHTTAHDRSEPAGSEVAHDIGKGGRRRMGCGHGSSFLSVREC